VELLVSFFSPPEEDANNFEKLDFKVIMLKTLTPKMYLLTLSQSIRTNSLLNFELINVSRRNYTTMNELLINWLFPFQKEFIQNFQCWSKIFLDTKQ
jgi:hypothetical protein